MSKLDKDIARVNRAISQYARRGAYRVVASVGIAIVGASIPKAPVDTGHLRNSSTVIASDGKSKRVNKRHKTIKKEDFQNEEINANSIEGFLLTFDMPVCVVSFLASYALNVHEGPPHYDWNDGGPKFLERGVNEQLPHIPVIAERAWKKDKASLSGEAKNALRRGKRPKND